MNKETVAIIGYGWLGKSIHAMFPDAYVYDLYQKIGHKHHVIQDIAFIGVPTPNLPNGRLDIKEVEEIVSWCECPLIVIRSTVNPGDTEYLSKKYGKQLVMQPEYLGETKNHPMLNLKDRDFMVLGGDKKNTRKLIELYTTAYNANIKIRQVTSLEAEVIKLSENRAIGFKVAQCQELYDVCEKAGVDYYTIRDAVYGDDPRFNLWWTFIFSRNRGMLSKCLPKDIIAWASWAESLGYDPIVTNGILYKNQEWLAGNPKGEVVTIVNNEISATAEANGVEYHQMNE